MPFVPFTPARAMVMSESGDFAVAFLYIHVPLETD